jgi:hypothetical protein
MTAKIKNIFAQIGVGALLIIVTWIGRGCYNDRQYATASGHKDTTMVNQNINLPATQSTLIGKPMPLSVEARRTIDSLKRVADRTWEMLQEERKEKVSVAQSARDSAKNAIDSLWAQALWLAIPFETIEEDTLGTTRVYADPTQKSIYRDFVPKVYMTSVPQVTTTLSLTTGVSIPTAVEIGFGGIGFGGVIAKDQKAMAIGVGGVVLVELLKRLF